MGSLTVLNLYRLTGTQAGFRAAVSALAARVEAEGERGVLSYRFFVDVTAGAARAVVDYDTPAAWIGHHEIAMAWPEMKALHAAARLEECIFLGSVTPEIRAWIAGSGLTARVVDGFAPAAGFRR
jgi:hypothetical protein